MAECSSCCRARQPPFAGAPMARLRIEPLEVAHSYPPLGVAGRGASDYLRHARGTTASSWRFGCRPTSDRRARRRPRRGSLRVNAAVGLIAIDAGDGDNVVRIAHDVLSSRRRSAAGPATTSSTAAAGRPPCSAAVATNKLVAGPGPTTLVGGPGHDLLYGGTGNDTFIGGAGAQPALRSRTPTRRGRPGRPVLLDVGPARWWPGRAANRSCSARLEVTSCSSRAAAASASNDAHHRHRRPQRPHPRRPRRGRRRPGDHRQRRRSWCSPSTGPSPRPAPAAFFGNNQAPLTSRTDPVHQPVHDHPARGRIEPEHHRPELAAPRAGLRRPGRHQAATSRRRRRSRRRSTCSRSSTPTATASSTPAPTASRAPADDIPLPQPVQHRPGVRPGRARSCSPPESYGFASGPAARRPSRAASPRCRAASRSTRTAQLVGGIGVFFPGTTGFATEENSALEHDVRPDASPTARWRPSSSPSPPSAAAPAAGFPVGDARRRRRRCRASTCRCRAAIDLVGITLDIFGPGGDQGPENLVDFGQPTSASAGQPGQRHRTCRSTAAGDTLLRRACPCPTAGWSLPHDGVGITAAEVDADHHQRHRAGQPDARRDPPAAGQPHAHGVRRHRPRRATSSACSACRTRRSSRSTWRWPRPATSPTTPTRRSCSRSTRCPGVPAGRRRSPTARSATWPSRASRRASTARRRARSRSSTTAASTRAPACRSARRCRRRRSRACSGFDAFNPRTNFRDPTNIAQPERHRLLPRQLAALHATRPAHVLVGGFGVSGDGVDQDDVVTVRGRRRLRARRRAAAGRPGRSSAACGCRTRSSTATRRGESRGRMGCC